ncbi:MAG: hypothetical protein AB7O65_01580 [Candidatus Korobacteraceae bacterium]
MPQVSDPLGTVRLGAVWVAERDKLWTVVCRIISPDCSNPQLFDLPIFQKKKSRGAA